MATTPTVVMVAIDPLVQVVGPAVRVILIAVRGRAKTCR